MNKPAAFHTGSFNLVQDFSRWVKAREDVSRSGRGHVSYHGRGPRECRGTGMLHVSTGRHGNLLGETAHCRQVDRCGDSGKRQLGDLLTSALGVRSCFLTNL